MNLDIHISHQGLTLVSTAPTALEPGAPLRLNWQITAETPILISNPVWTVAGRLPDLPAADLPGFPLTLAAGESRNIDLELSTGLPQEGYGWIHLELPVRLTAENVETTVKWKHWLSVFKLEQAGAEPAISDSHRERLMGVVNADERNGHIFLADYLVFFREFLHLEIPPSLAELIVEGLGIPMEGLPLPEDEFLDIARGVKTFFGLDRLELLPEEEGEDCDDCYEYEHLYEQIPSEVELI